MMRNMYYENCSNDDFEQETILIEFCDNISLKEQQLITDWLKKNTPQSCQIVKINGVVYNLRVFFENTQIVAIRVYK